MIEEYILEAESWIGTPFRLQAKVKGQGVDCNTLIFEALCAAGIAYDPRDRGVYRIMEHRNPGPGMAAMFERLVGDKFIKVLTSKFKRGDILAFRLHGKLLHVSIAVNSIEHIHADAESGVILDVVEPSLLSNLDYVYRPVEVKS